MAPAPRPLYDPAWVATHSHDWDLVHLHFTWEQYPVGVLTAVLDAHRRAGRPILWTTHDLRNPHTADSSADELYLRLLADRADAVVTLTPGAATEVRRRFGRHATVTPHGPLVPTAEATRWRQRRPARTAAVDPAAAREVTP